MCLIPIPKRVEGHGGADRLDEPITVSRDERVPRDNVYRHLETAFDLSFVRELVQERYAGRGRPSIDPVVFFTLRLILFFGGIRSERKLIEMASRNLSHRWHVGYALDEDLPDHSRLTRIRQLLIFLASPIKENSALPSRNLRQPAGRERHPGSGPR